MSRTTPNARLLVPLAVVVAVLGLALLWPRLLPSDADAPAVARASGSAAAQNQTADRRTASVDPDSGLPWVDLADLPVEAGSAGGD